MTPAEPTAAHIEEARALVRGRAQDLGLQGCHVAICAPCLDGKGGECHTPGCLFWMVSAPDVPIRERAEASDGYHIGEALAAKDARAAAAEERARQAGEMAERLALRSTEWQDRLEAAEERALTDRRALAGVLADLRERLAGARHHLDRSLHAEDLASYTERVGVLDELAREYEAGAAGTALDALLLAERTRIAALLEAEDTDMARHLAEKILGGVA